MAKNSSKRNVSNKKLLKRNEKYVLGPMHFSVRSGVFRDYFETFHAVHSCSQSLLFIPNECTYYVKYIYMYLSPITYMNQHTKTGEQRTGSSQYICTITDPNTAGYSEHIYCQHT